MEWKLKKTTGLALLIVKELSAPRACGASGTYLIDFEEACLNDRNRVFDRTLDVVKNCGCLGKIRNSIWKRWAGTIPDGESGMRLCALCSNISLVFGGLECERHFRLRIRWRKGGIWRDGC